MSWPLAANRNGRPSFCSCSSPHSYCCFHHDLTARPFLRKYFLSKVMLLTSFEHVFNGSVVNQSEHQDLGSSKLHRRGGFDYFQWYITYFYRFRFHFLKGESRLGVRYGTRPVGQPYAGVNYIPYSGTMNLATRKIARTAFWKSTPNFVIQTEKGIGLPLWGYIGVRLAKCTPRKKSLCHLAVFLFWMSLAIVEYSLVFEDPCILLFHFLSEYVQRKLFFCIIFVNIVSCTYLTVLHFVFIKKRHYKCTNKILFLCYKFLFLSIIDQTCVTVQYTVLVVVESTRIRSNKSA